MRTHTEVTAGYIADYAHCGLAEIAEIGEKNALLAEIESLAPDGQLRIPPGFIVRAAAYRRLISSSHLGPLIDHVSNELAAQRIDIREAGRSLRSAIQRASMPEDLVDAIGKAYRRLTEQAGAEVIVRPSPTPVAAAIAGQHDAFLNVVGELELIDACRNCYASMFTDRAIRNRLARSLAVSGDALPLSVQHLVRADHGGSGTVDVAPESGGSRVTMLACLGFQGPHWRQACDDYRLWVPDDGGAIRVLQRRCGSKPSKCVYDCDHGALRDMDTDSTERQRMVLNEAQMLRLARRAVAAARHLDRPLQLEWASERANGMLHLIQVQAAVPYASSDTGCPRGIPATA